ncbi:MAG: hypothetical protein JSS81_23625 [Acidobacteria bacterium]|nr:hypothetical protein [Acidobacteriota bacterium]
MKNNRLRPLISAITFLSTFLVGAAVFVSGQIISSSVEIVTVYSQSQKFFLKTVPYDNESPTLRGKTSVYRAGNPKPLYEFERGFDFLDYANNFLFLSDDGETVFFVIGFDADEKTEGLKSVTVYKKGTIVKSYTEPEITGCDHEKERCRLVYNDENLSDAAKAANRQEKFLDDFPVFAAGGIVYLTDSKKITHLFDLKSGELVKSAPFDQLSAELMSRARKTRYVEQRYDAPTYADFPNLRDGKNTVRALAAFLGMKPYGIYDKKDQQFRRYSFEISAYVRQDGDVEIESIDADEGLSKEKIAEFFKTHKFASAAIPKAFPKWFISREVIFLRKADDTVARRERNEQLVKEREDLQKRLVAEKIDDVYIPKDLGECFVELDKSLKEVDKNEMRALPKRDDMIRYHMGLGMWMRNNWGLWGGSRLQKYFTDRGIRHPDDMSSVVLFYYYDWLNGKTEIWKDWEKNPRSPFDK